MNPELCPTVPPTQPGDSGRTTSYADDVQYSPNILDQPPCHIRIENCDPHPSDITFYLIITPIATLKPELNSVIFILLVFDNNTALIINPINYWDPTGLVVVLIHGVNTNAAWFERARGKRGQVNDDNFY
ncbi:hypothetical protein BVX99_01705 [bacterium F16]|nr:hypothetical protein BVX99_01705 [bacterium F16]